MFRRFIGCLKISCGNNFVPFTLIFFTNSTFRELKLYKINHSFFPWNFAVILWLGVLSQSKVWYQVGGSQIDFNLVVLNYWKNLNKFQYVFKGWFVLFCAWQYNIITWYSILLCICFRIKFTNMWSLPVHSGGVYFGSTHISA